MKFICPLITVANIEISRQFYVEILQQKVKYDFGANVSFEGNFAIHLDTHFSQLIGDKPITKGGNAFELYFEHNEMKVFTNRLKAADVVFVHELREQPWRQLVVRFYDPDGHIVEVGESIEHLCFRLFGEGMSINEIAAIVLMPVEFVKNSIQMNFSTENNIKI